jgi:hypothetical protein
MNINLTENNINELGDTFEYDNLESRLIIIEVNINLLNSLLKMMNNKTFFIINIIPKNIDKYKNKLINKIFIDIKKKSNNFISNIKNTITDKEKLIEKISEQIDKITNSDKSIMSQDDFVFLNKPIIKLIDNGKICKTLNSSYEILDIEF